MKNDVYSQNGVDFLGLRFQPGRVDDLARELADRDQSRYGYVVTPNVDHMVRLNADASLQPLYVGAERVLNDSKVLELLARLDGKKLEASPGADLVSLLFKRYIGVAERVAIVGGSAETVAALREKYPMLDVRWHDAPMGLRTDPKAVAACAAFMAANPARFTFICVGSPQQELVAWAAKERGDCEGVAICCGASLEFLVGQKSRAPSWMRQARLEWLHRLASEPRRLARRYVVDGPKIFRIWWSARNQKAELAE